VHIVQFSTGMSSAEVAWRLVAEHGQDSVLLMTADTLKEDPDNWRFAREVVGRLGCEWVKLTDGRTPMQVGRDERCVPNNRMAVCSKILKRQLLRSWLDARHDPSSDVIYIGYDWSEPNRIASSARYWAPWTVRAPLAEPPYAQPLGALFRSRGIEPPDLYRYGFPHANCGGACVRGGQAQWSLLLQVNRPRYLEWEADEEQSRELLGKDVSILRDRREAVMARFGKAQPIPLRVFREGIENQSAMFDADDWGACGCDMDGEGDDPGRAEGVRSPRTERWDGSQWAPIPDAAAEAHHAGSSA
jgi:hypothetical protein